MARRPSSCPYGRALPSTSLTGTLTCAMPESLHPWLLAGSQPRGRSGRRRVLRDAELGQQLERVEVQTRRHEAVAALFVDHAEGGGHVSPGRGEDRAVTTLQG